MHTYTCTCTYTYTLTCTHNYTHTHTRTHTYTYTHTHTSTSRRTLADVRGIIGAAGAPVGAKASGASAGGQGELSRRHLRWCAE